MKNAFDGWKLIIPDSFHRKLKNKNLVGTNSIQSCENVEMIKNFATVRTGETMQASWNELIV